MNDSFLTFLLIIGTVWLWWFATYTLVPDNSIAKELSQVSVTLSSPGPAIQRSEVPFSFEGAALR